MKKKLSQGFTLIELLVVIAIIAIITSLGIVNLITAQKQARDSARKEIMSNIQTAFEQYYVASASYPVETEEINSAFDNNQSPTDPKNSGEYILVWNSSASEYCICAKLESGNGNASEPNSTTCIWENGAEYYCIQNKQ